MHAHSRVTAYTPLWRTAAAHIQQTLCGEASGNLRLKCPSASRCRSASEEDAIRRGKSALQLDKHTISAVRLNKLNPDDHLHGNKVSPNSSLCSRECMLFTSTGTAACALHVTGVQGLRRGNACTTSMDAAHVRVHTHSLTKTAMEILKRPRFRRFWVSRTDGRTRR